MNALAKREVQVWQDVDRLLERGGKTASVYDEATAMLKKLQQLIEFQGTRDVFQVRIRPLAEKYASRPSLMKRWIRTWLGLVYFSDLDPPHHGALLQVIPFKLPSVPPQTGNKAV